MEKIKQTIYLIESGNYYKIGRSANFANRLKSFNTANPNWNFIDSFEGIADNEIELHNLCSKYHYRNEWFHKCDEVLTIFQNYNKLNIISKKLDNIEKEMLILSKKLISQLEYQIKCNIKEININKFNKLSLKIDEANIYLEYCDVPDIFKEVNDLLIKINKLYYILIGKEIPKEFK